jgi:uncharacterized protein (TIGR02444 family)
MMKISPSELEAESWAFALEIYARPGVADACLTLQNEAGVDIMMLLMVIFAAVKHRHLLTREEIRSLNDVCRPWREQIVWPLRKMRTGLKTGPSPAPGAATEEFRSKIKSLELAAERLQNQLLAENLPLGPPDNEPISRERLRTVMVQIVTILSSREGQDLTARLSESIEVIVAAALREAA